MARLHQDNFATNLTSNQVAGVTTTPLNDIPSIAAPFYLAFDATNINGKYEVVDVTSKTATNVLHAATTYEHTAAEEVRMVVPAVELDGFVGATDTVTLTNKTLTTPTINGATLTGTQAYGDNAPNITPKASAYRNAAQSIPNTTVTICAYDTEKFDVGGDFNTTNGVFTAPVTGYYFVSHNVSMAGIAAAKRVISYVYVNGSAAMEADATTGTTTNSGCLACGVFYVEAGQTIDGRVYQDGGTLNLVHSSQGSQINIHLIST